MMNLSQAEIDNFRFGSSGDCGREPSVCGACQGSGKVCAGCGDSLYDCDGDHNYDEESEPEDRFVRCSECNREEY